MIESNSLDQPCEPCKKGATAATDQEQALWLKELDGWQIIDKEGVNQLVNIYSANDFASAFLMAQKVGDLAEAVDHHPALLIEWGRVTVTWWTHSLSGLHKNDFIMAKRTSEILSNK